MGRPAVGERVARHAGTEVHEAHEAQRAAELAGYLLRLWRLPGESRALGLRRARDAAEMRAILGSLSLDAWMTVETARSCRIEGR